MNLLNLEDKENIIAKIGSGIKRIQVANEFFILLPLTPTDKALSQEIYNDALTEGMWDGMYTQNDLLVVMRRLRLWSDAEEEKIQTIYKDIETMKTKIFELQFKSIEKKNVRRLLRTAEKQLDELIGKKNMYWSVSAEGFATIIKLRYIIGRTLARNNMEKIPFDEAILYADDILSESIDKITEAEYREVARTEPWRSIWNTRHSEKGVFGVPSIFLTDEQKALSVWSGTYDRILEHSECPSEEVLNDDDALDGWCIVQRRKVRGNPGNADINPNIANSEEVYIPADTVEDAKKIDSLNDTYGKKMKQLNFSKIDKEGTVSHEKLPDMRFKYMEAASKLSGRG